MNLYKLLVLLVCCGLSQLVVGQTVDSVGYMEISLEQISIEQGLSQGMVNDIAEDQTGFLWVATKEGLNRYDGTGFRVFRHIPDNPYSLADNFTYSLEVDTNNRVWVTTQSNGVDLFDPKSETFHHFRRDSLNPNAISSNQTGILLKDHNQNILVETLDEEGFAVITEERSETKSGFIFRPITEIYPSLLPFKTGKDWTKHLVFGSDKSIWYYDLDSVYHITGDLYSTDAQVDAFYIAPRIFRGGKDATVFIPSKNKSELYITDNEQTLLKFSEAKNQFVPFLKIPAPHKFGFKQFIDSKNRLWSWNDDHTAIRIDLNTLEYVKISPRWNQLRGLATNHTGIALEDANGNLWMGTGGNGLLQIKRTIDLFKRVPSAQKMIDNSIRIFRIETANQKALYKNSIRTAWIELRKDLLRRKGNFLLSDSNCHLSMDNEGHFWIGSYDLAERTEYLLKIDTVNGSMTKVCSKHHDDGEWYAMPVFLDREDNIWFGEKFSSNGVNLYYYNQVTDSLITYSMPVEKRKVEYRLISDWYQNEQGNWWLATTQGLLYLEVSTGDWNVYKQQSGNPNSLSFDVCLSVHPDPIQPSKFLWVGTEGGGLNKLNIETGGFSHFNTQTGLPNNVIYGIQSDNHNHLWISTNNGLCQFNPETNQCVNYTSEDGLPGNEFNRYEYSKTTNGTLYFGGTRGQVYFNPEDFYAKNEPSNVIVTDLFLFNQPVRYSYFGVDSSSFSLTKPIGKTERLTFGPDQDMISFSFAVMDLTAPSKNQFKYRLVGLQDDWISAGSKNEATFTDLSPGSYTLEVIGSNSHNVWSSKPTTLSIDVLPPWYATNWFRALVLFLAATVLYLIYRQRVSQLLHIEKMRNRIAQDLHDEIGSTLSSISLFSTVLEKTLDDNPEKAKPILERITKNCNQMMESMNDMVWTIKADNDKFSEIVNRMRAFAVNMAEPKGIKLVFEADQESESLKLDMETRKNIYLLFKEATNNAVKYSNCSELKVNVSIKEHKLILCICDNGIGFEVDTESGNRNNLGGNGIKGMKARAAQSNAKLQIKSEKSVGTEIIMTLSVKNH